LWDRVDSRDVEATRPGRPPFIGSFGVLLLVHHAPTLPVLQIFTCLFSLALCHMSVEYGMNISIKIKGLRYEMNGLKKAGATETTQLAEKHSNGRVQNPQ
jgi:hypothetical protein